MPQNFICHCYQLGCDRKHSGERNIKHSANTDFYRNGSHLEGRNTPEFVGQWPRRRCSCRNCTWRPLRHPTAFAHWSLLLCEGSLLCTCRHLRSWSASAKQESEKLAQIVELETEAPMRLKASGRQDISPIIADCAKHIGSKEQ